MAVNQIRLHIVIYLRLCIVVHCQRECLTRPGDLRINPEILPSLLIGILHAYGQNLRTQL